MGTNVAYYQDGHNDHVRTDRNNFDETDESYYAEQLAEDIGHGEGLFERSDDGKSQDRYEDNHHHDPDEFQRTYDSEY